MVELESLYLSTRKEARLANVKVEVLQRAISKADNGILFANGALGVMSCRLGHNESMQHGQPNDGLRLQLEPFEKVLQVDFARIVGVFEATAH